MNREMDGLRRASFSLPCMMNFGVQHTDQSPLKSHVLCDTFELWIISCIYHPKVTLTDISVPSAALCLLQADTPHIKLYTFTPSPPGNQAHACFGL